MTTPFIDEVGLGFFIEKHGNALYFGHGGADEGFRAELLVNKNKGYGVAVMANSDNGQILREVIRAVAREYGWDEFLPAPYEIIPLSAAKLKSFDGRFQLGPDSVLTVTTDPATPATGTTQPAKLIGQRTGEPAVEFLPISETAFVLRDDDVKVEFLLSGANKGAESVRIVADGRTSEGKRISADTLIPFELLSSGKLAEGIDGYRRVKKENPAHESVSENRLNNLGYSLMRQKKLTEAIALFKLNVELYPSAWNAYDSLGEAYMTNGDKNLAIANYKKSLELNSGNVNGAEILKKLETAAKP